MPRPSGRANDGAHLVVLGRGDELLVREPGAQRQQRRESDDQHKAHAEAERLRREALRAARDPAAPPAPLAELRISELLARAAKDAASFVAAPEAEQPVTTLPVRLPAPLDYHRIKLLDKDVADSMRDASGREDRRRISNFNLVLVLVIRIN